MARRGKKTSKKCAPRPRDFTLDLKRLPREAVEGFERAKANWKAAEPAARARDELMERVAKREAYRAAIRDGLIPPPWQSSKKPKRTAKREPDYPRDAIRAIAEEALKKGRDEHRSWFYDRVRELCRQPRIKAPASDRTMGRIIGDLYPPPKRTASRK